MSIQGSSSAGSTRRVELSKRRKALLAAIRSLNDRELSASAQLWQHEAHGPQKAATERESVEVQPAEAGASE